MKSSELISIIVPAYNVENKINRCIDSLINQTYENIEIIIINDGSTDNTEKNCEKYKENKKVKYFYINNSGVSEARNFGIKNSTGKYIIFVDSDDYAEYELVERLYKNITNSDLVICSKNVVTENQIIREKINLTEKILKKEDVLTLYKAKILNPPYCKLYKSNIIKSNNIKFDKNISIGEDLLFNIEYIKNINKNIVILNENLYNYEKIQGNSLSQKYYKNMLEIKSKIVKKMRENIYVKNEEKIDFEILVFDLLLSSVTNELKCKSKKFLDRYKSGYNIIKKEPIQKQIMILKQKNILKGVEYRLLNSYLYIVYIIFFRKRI